MATLRVTPEELMELANQIAQNAEDLNGLATSLDKKVEDVTDSWKGMSSNAYYNKYVEMQEALHKFPEVVQGIASSAQGAATVYDQTDEQIKQAMA